MCKWSGEICGRYHGLVSDHTHSSVCVCEYVCVSMCV